MKRNKSTWGWIRNLRIIKITSVHNDRVLPETRWMSFWIVPFYLAAFVILTLWPADTGQLFAWGMPTAISPLILGAACAGGALFFSRAYMARYWHTIGMGFLPAMIFSVLGGIATLTEWGNFDHNGIAFIAWAVFFAITCWLVPWVWIRNRATDPHMPAMREIMLSDRAAWVLTGTGSLILVLAAYLYLFPDSAVMVWPWAQATLDARILGALLAMLASTLMAMALDRRWSAIRIPLQSVALSLGLVLVSVIRSWKDFNPANPLTWLFVGASTALFVGVAVMYLWIEIR